MRCCDKCEKDFQNAVVNVEAPQVGAPCCIGTEPQVTMLSALNYIQAPTSAATALKRSMTKSTAAARPPKPNAKFNTVTIRLVGEPRPITIKAAERETLIKMLKQVLEPF